MLTSARILKIKQLEVAHFSPLKEGRFLEQLGTNKFKNSDFFLVFYNHLEKIGFKYLEESFEKKNTFCSSNLFQLMSNNVIVYCC